ncbi:hypothetical protein BDD43_5171 [Mucilaginibacter gracilis]|uniref:Uncharacterized protein n=1 Tax=Mucilaginibacter gracilis TaxID=423350 RepID=A0A495J8X0_9SPHI|nr:hypothetical protein BDD43_5171 [Mucilaginibacter gracilis]
MILAKFGHDAQNGFFTNNNKVFTRLLVYLLHIYCALGIVFFGFVIKINPQYV